MRKNTIILTTLLVLSIINITSAQVILNPRSVGMAGTFATQARGDEVIGWNPANLAYDDNPNFGLSFGILPLVPFPNLQVNNDLLTLVSTTNTPDRPVPAGWFIVALGSISQKQVKSKESCSAQAVGQAGHIAYCATTKAMACSRVWERLTAHSVRPSCPARLAARP